MRPEREDVAGARTHRARLIDVDGLQALIDALRTRGFTVIGPTVKAGAIVNAAIRVNGTAATSFG